MTQPETPTLWAVHVQGPDDLLAARTREHAEREAVRINAAWAAYRAEHPAIPGISADLHAVVVPWIYTAEAHTADVERLERHRYDG